jgi:hypothetical protein
MQDAHTQVSPQSDCPEYLVLDLETGERTIVKPGQNSGIKSHQ